MDVSPIVQGNFMAFMFQMNGKHAVLMNGINGTVVLL